MWRFAAILGSFCAPAMATAGALCADAVPMAGDGTLVFTAIILAEDGAVAEPPWPIDLNSDIAAVAPPLGDVGVTCFRYRPDWLGLTLGPGPAQQVRVGSEAGATLVGRIPASHEDRHVLLRGGPALADLARTDLTIE